MLDLLVAASVVPLVNLSQVATTHKIPGALLLVLLPMWLVIFKNLFAYPCLVGFPRRSATGWPLIAWVTVIFVAWVGVGLVRALGNQALPGVLQTLGFLLTTALFAYAVFSRFRTVEPDKTIRAVAAGIGIYLLLNVALHLVGAKPPPIGGPSATSDAVMLSAIGINAPRVFFPLASGLNGYAVVSGLGVVLAFTMLKGGNRIFWPAVLGAGIASILLGDSRGAALFTILAVAFFLIVPNAIRRRAHWFVILAPAFSVAAIAVLMGLAGSGTSSPILQDLVYLFSRPDVATEDIGAGRALVWDVAADELTKPKPIHIVGYGAYGQVVANISRYYDSLFTYLDRPELATLHNAALQYAIDNGYIGTALFFSLIFLLARTWLAPAAMFLVLMGLTEAVPTIYFRDALFVFLMMCAYAATIHRKSGAVYESPALNSVSERVQGS